MQGSSRYDHPALLSCRELMRGEVLRKPVKKDSAIRIDDIDSPYSSIESLRSVIYARGIDPASPDADKKAKDKGGAD